MQDNRIDDVMVIALSSSVVDRGFESGRVKPKIKKLVFVHEPTKSFDFKTECTPRVRE
jgi:hypothetical protein